MIHLFLSFSVCFFSLPHFLSCSFSSLFRNRQLTCTPHIPPLNSCRRLLGGNLNADVGRTAHQTLALQAHWDAFVTGLESLMQPLWHACARNKQSHVFVVEENPGQPSLRAKLVSDINVFFYIFYEKI